jgi:hypothetical protein
MVQTNKLQLPVILEFYVFDEPKKFIVNRPKESVNLKCKSCSQSVRASLKVTSNWVSHLKAKHEIEFQNYLNRKIVTGQFR